jgi:glycosyltransferase involved in cell wall biosynthesis
LKPNSPELRQRFAEADLFAFPTQADCLPVAVLEAMAAGLPVITTSVAALPEVVRHGETGIIVPIGEEKALGGALCDLVRDNCLRHRLGEQARARARTHYDAALVYGNLLQLLYDL